MQKHVLFRDITDPSLIEQVAAIFPIGNERLLRMVQVILVFVPVITE